MSTIISDLYDVKITAPKSQIKYQEKIPITIKLIDFNGNGISEKNVTISTNNGAFLLNGNVGVGQNYTFFNLSSDGATIGFTMSTTGIAIINVKINNKIKGSLQIFTEDYERVLLNTVNSIDTTYLYVNKKERICVLPYGYNKKSLTKGNSTSGYGKIMEDTIIPEEYNPLGVIVANTYRPDIAIYISNRNIYYRVEEDKSSLGADLKCLLTWTY